MLMRLFVSFVCICFYVGSVCAIRELSAYDCGFPLSWVSCAFMAPLAIVWVVGVLCLFLKWICWLVLGDKDA